MKNNIKINKNTKHHKKVISSPSEFSIKDEAISSHIETLKIKLENGIKIHKIPFVNDLLTFELVKYLLKKPQKTKEDSLFISHYLSTFPLLKGFLQQSNTQYDPLKYLCKLSKKIQIEQFNNGDIIYKLGDRADKVYIILEGTVCIIGKKEKKVEMFLYEYIKYMEYLLSIGEKELYDINISANRLIYTQVEVNQYTNGKVNIDEEFPDLSLLNDNKEKVYIQYEKSFYTRSNIPIYEYVNRLHPKVLNLNEKELTHLKRIFHLERKTVSIWILYIINDICKFDIFGEMFTVENTLRNVTTICTKNNTYLGIIDKNTYMSTIMEYHDKYKRNLIRNCEVFKNINQDVFIKNYFHYFYAFTLYQGDYLFKQGNTRTKIYYLTEGLIEISFKGTFTDLAEVIIKDKQYYFDINEDIIKCRDNLLFSKYYLNTVHIFKLFQIGNKDLIGLDDFTSVNNSNEYDVNVICKSSPCKFLAIDMELFMYIISKQDNGEMLLNRFINKKKNFCGKRMFALRQLIIDQKYKEFKKKTDFTIENISKINKSFSNNVINKTICNLPKDFNVPKHRKLIKKKSSIFITENTNNDNINISSNIKRNIHKLNKRKIRSLSVDKATSTNCSFIKSNQNNNISTNSSFVKLNKSIQRILVYKKDKKRVKEIKKEFYSTALSPEKENDDYLNKVYESMFKKYIDNTNEKTNMSTIPYNVDFLAIERTIHPYQGNGIKVKNNYNKIRKISYVNIRKHWNKRNRFFSQGKEHSIFSLYNSSQIINNNEYKLFRKKRKDTKHREFINLSLMLPEVETKQS